MDDPLVSIVVPAYNEAATIEEVLRRLSAVPFRTRGHRRRRRLDRRHGAISRPPSTACGSSAARATPARAPPCATASPPRTRRRSSSSRTPTSSTTPRTCPRCSSPLLEGHADAVYGTRLRGGEPQRAHLFWHYAGNRFLSLLTNVLFNTTISDMEVGYKAFRGDLIRGLRLVSDDFRFEPEVTAKVLKIPGIRLYEVPISYYGRTVRRGQEDHVARRDQRARRPRALPPAGLSCRGGPAPTLPRHERRDHGPRLRRPAARRRVRRGGPRRRGRRRRPAQGRRARPRRVLHRGHPVRAPPGRRRAHRRDDALRRPRALRRGARSASRRR